MSPSFFYVPFPPPQAQKERFYLQYELFGQKYELHTLMQTLALSGPHLHVVVSCPELKLCIKGCNRQSEPSTLT